MSCFFLALIVFNNDKNDNNHNTKYYINFTCL